MTGVAGYVAGRLLQSAVLLVFVVTIGFFVIRTAPGDPVLYLYGAQNISAETLAALRQAWGLDRPLAEQYWIYVTNLASGNLGYSQINREVVSAMLARKVPNTLLLMAPSILLAAAGGVVLGTTACRRLNTLADHVIGVVSMVGYSTPPFWLGILLIVLFASTLGWLPTQGMATLGASYRGLAHALDVARHMVLPVTVLTW